MSLKRFKFKFDSDVKDAEEGLKKVLKASGSLCDETRSLGSEINRLSQTSSQIASYKKYQSELEQNSIKSKVARERLEELQKAFKDVEKPTLAMVSSLHRARDKVDALAQKEGVLSQRVQTLKDSFKAQNIGLDGLDEAYKRINDKKKDHQRILDGEIQKTRRLTEAREEAKKRQDKLLERTSQMAITGHAAMSWGSQIASKVASPVSNFIDFESKLSVLEAKGFSDKSPEERAKIKEELRQEAMKHGAQTSYSASEVVDAQIVMASAGIGVGDIKSSMETILSVAKATGVSLSDAVEVSQASLSQFSGQYKKGFDEVSGVGDILAHTVKSAKLELNDVKETLKQAGLAASESGVSFELANAMIVSMAKNSLRGSEAGTQMKGIFTRLAKGTKESVGALSSLNVEVSKNGKMRNYADILFDLSKAMANKKDKEKESLAAMIAGQEAFPGLLSLLKTARMEMKNEDGTITYINGLKKIEAEMRNSAGTAKTMADIMKDNTRNSVDEMSASWEALSLVLVGNVKDPLNDLILTGKEVIDWVKDFAQNNPVLTNSLLMMGAGVVGLTVSAGALLVPIATMGLLAAKSAVGVRVLSKAFRGLNTATRANPLGVLLTVAEIAFPFIITNLDYIMEKLGKAWDWAKGIFSMFSSENEVSFDVNKKYISEKKESIESAFSLNNLLRVENSMTPVYAGVGAGVLRPVKNDIKNEVEIKIYDRGDAKEVAELTRKTIEERLAESIADVEETYMMDDA